MVIYYNIKISELIRKDAKLKSKHVQRIQMYIRKEQELDLEENKVIFK